MRLIDADEVRGGIAEAWRACDGGQSDLEAALSQIMPPLYPETGKGEAW